MSDRRLDLDGVRVVLLAGDGDGSEGLGQLAHGLQTAWELRRAFPDDAELHVAGLVHDIGHQLAPGDDAGHGRVAATSVRDLFGDRLADLVELHVPAKRYLVAMHPGYADVLSATSTITLARQGGTMTPTEVERFLAQPCADGAVALRLADDAAKEPGRVVPGLDHWWPVVTAVAAARDRSSAST